MLERTLHLIMPVAFIFVALNYFHINLKVNPHKIITYFLLHQSTLYRYSIINVIYSVIHYEKKAKLIDRFITEKGFISSINCFKIASISIR